MHFSRLTLAHQVGGAEIQSIPPLRATVKHMGWILPEKPETERPNSSTHKLLGLIKSIYYNHLKGSLKQSVQFTLRLQLLDVRVASDVLAVNENIRNSSLLGDLVQVVLDLSAVRNSVDFQDVGLVSKSRNGALGLGTVRAVVLGKDHHWVLFDQVVHFGLGSVGNHSG